MKVALVGLGYWGEKILRNLVALLGTDHLLAVDRRPDRVEAVRAAYPGIACAPSIDTVIADDDVQAVVLATPAASHSPLGREVLRAGRHLLVEKPLATSVADAEGLVQLALELDLRLMVGHTFLFSPRVEVLAQSLKDGSVGNVHYVTTSRLNLGLYHEDINVIWDLAPHDFSIVFHVLGEFPVLVQTMARNSRRGVPDVAFMHLEFPSGVIASATVSWRAPRKVRNTVVVGDRGMIVYDDTQPDEPVKIYDRGVVSEESANFGEHQLTYRHGDTVSPYISAQEPLTRELAHFLSCMNDPGQQCLSDGWFGYDVVRALEAAERSSRLGGVPVAVGVSPAAA